MIRRIVCIGNRYRERDAAGPRVFDLLAARDLPPGVEAVDGGLAGLGLLPLLDGASRVVFVDAVEGAEPAAGPVVLDPVGPENPGSWGRTLDHASGLLYLLRLPAEVYTRSVPERIVVGVPAGGGPELVTAAADLSVSLALLGRPSRREDDP